MATTGAESAVCWYRCSLVCLFICFGHESKVCKNSWTERDAAWCVDWRGDPRNHVILGRCPVYDCVVVIVTCTAWRRGVRAGGGPGSVQRSGHQVALQPRHRPLCHVHVRRLPRQRQQVQRRARVPRRLPRPRSALPATVTNIAYLWYHVLLLQCFDTVGWASGKASGL